MIKQIHHIALVLSSEKNLEFYRILGFQETFRKVRKYDLVVLMCSNGIQLEIFIDSKYPTRNEINTKSTGLRHLALRVDGKLEYELERIKRELREDVEFGKIMNDWRGERFVLVKDPDGIEIELHE